MLIPDPKLTPASLAPKIERLFSLSAAKITALEKRWKEGDGAPVFTWQGRYTTRGWTEWTQGFQYGAAILQYDYSDDSAFLDLGRRKTVDVMASHVTHIGVHDHGFNNVSTYGNLLRLMNEGRLPHDAWEKNFYEMALKASGAVQAARWTALGDKEGYIYSFNGPHSLFADTIRSCRALAVAHQLGHRLMGERDRSFSLLDRLLQHAAVTARFNIYYGEGRDAYDVAGRAVHESIFNLNDKSYRCPSSQQGYSPFTTWTRGHAWLLCGYPELLEFLEDQPEEAFAEHGGKEAVIRSFEKIAVVLADFYLSQTPTDGIPYWDTGAPGLAKMGDYLSRPAEVHNDFEPVDSSAACIGAQGLARLGDYLARHDRAKEGQRYTQAALTIADTLFAAPYLSEDAAHEGLILHSIYHRPNGWDYIPPGRKIPCGESSMWGDYHARELALYLHRQAKGLPDYRFFSKTTKKSAS